MRSDGPWPTCPGHEDFQFHVYTKTDEPDPDTGYNFGELRPSRKMIAWGGTSSRTWFYDLSAGPEAWTDNWNVDTPDLDGNGVEDYRMPPIWEYAAGGYRDSGALGLAAATSAWQAYSLVAAAAEQLGIAEAAIAAQLEPVGAPVPDAGDPIRFTDN